MKFFTSLFLCAFAVSGRAQITLEHNYRNAQYPDFGFVQVDSAEWKYVQQASDTVILYNLDHSLDHYFVIPDPESESKLLLTVSRGLFTTDNSFGYLVQVLSNGVPGLRIYNDDGLLLFSRDSALIVADRMVPGVSYATSLALRNTPGGTKLIVATIANGYEVYSLPGKLPNYRSPSHSDGAPSPTPIRPSIASSAYPNPSSKIVRITYELPAGVTIGEIVLTSEDGREVKRYRVTNAFSDILIDDSELPSGSYFYKVVTERGESEAKRIVVMK